MTIAQRLPQNHQTLQLLGYICSLFVWGYLIRIDDIQYVVSVVIYIYGTRAVCISKISSATFIVIIGLIFATVCFGFIFVKTGFEKYIYSHTMFL